MSMGLIAPNLEDFFDGLDGSASPEENFESFNDRIREPGNIGGGVFDDFISVS